MSRIKRTGLVLVLLLCCALLLTSCGVGDNNAKPAAATEAPAKSAALSFVAADKTNWDKEVTIGDYAFTLAIELEDGGTATLNATCKGTPAAGGNGGMGGSEGSEGSEDAEPTPEPVELTDEEKAAKNFTQSGSWSYDKGYGYTIEINGYSTKTSYDKASARQIIYMEITNEGANSGLIQFQAKDTAFRSEMAEDYADYEIRDAQYIFSGTGSTATGNASSTKVYLEKDGIANSKVQQGSSPTYTRGSWTENADKSLTINLGGVYSADYCDISGKEGYRLTYNSSTMYATVSGEAVEYVDSDFDGETKITLQCAEQDYTVELTEKGFANVYKNGAKDSAGKYTEQDGIITVVLDDTTYRSEDGVIKLSFKDNSQNASSGGGDPIERTFNTDGSVPEAAAPVEGEGASDGEAAEGEAASDGEAASAGEAAGGEGAPAEGDGEAASDGEASDGEASDGEGAPEGDAP